MPFSALLSSGARTLVAIESCGWARKLRLSPALPNVTHANAGRCRCEDRFVDAPWGIGSIAVNCLQVRVLISAVSPLASGIIHVRPFP